MIRDGNLHGSTREPRAERFAMSKLIHEIENEDALEDAQESQRRGCQMTITALLNGVEPDMPEKREQLQRALELAPRLLASQGLFPQHGDLLERSGGRGDGPRATPEVRARVHEQIEALGSFVGEICRRVRVGRRLCHAPAGCGVLHRRPRWASRLRGCDTDEADNKGGAR